MFELVIYNKHTHTHTHTHIPNTQADTAREMDIKGTISSFQHHFAYQLLMVHENVTSPVDTSIRPQCYVTHMGHSLPIDDLL